MVAVARRLMPPHECVFQGNRTEIKIQYLWEAYIIDKKKRQVLNNTNSNMTCTITAIYFMCLLYAALVVVAMIVTSGTYSCIQYSQFRSQREYRTTYCTKMSCFSLCSELLQTSRFGVPFNSARRFWQNHANRVSPFWMPCIKNAITSTSISCALHPQRFMAMTPYHFMSHPRESHFLCVSVSVCF